MGNMGNMGNMGKNNYTNFPITHISEKMSNFAGAIMSPRENVPLSANSGDIRNDCLSVN